jgi:DNA-binding response OmpR family regulator
MLVGQQEWTNNRGESQCESHYSKMILTKRHYSWNGLSPAGPTCEHFSAGKQFIRKIKHDNYDVLMLDWMVPDMDGYEALRCLRENFDWPVPIVFVTAKDEEDDIVRALEQGAGDYIVKPAKHRELVARITSVARRASAVDETQNALEYEPFAIDLGNHEVKRDGARVEVTQKEYELIVFLF